MGRKRLLAYKQLWLITPGKEGANAATRFEVNLEKLQLVLCGARALREGGSGRGVISHFEDAGNLLWYSLGIHSADPDFMLLCQQSPCSKGTFQQGIRWQTL